MECGFCIVVALAVFILLIYMFVNKVSPKKFNLVGSHVMITGGSQGIGYSLAVEVMKRGANVTLVARDQLKLDSRKSELERDFKIRDDQWVRTVSLDISDATTVEDTLKAHINEVGPVDVLINNAGIFTPSTFLESPLEEFKKHMDINYLGCVYVTHALLPSMKTLPRGRIVFVSSSAGLMGVFGYTAYCASKFALRGLAEGLQMEVLPDDIRITMAFPCDVDTEGYKEAHTIEPKETKQIAASGGLVQPKDVAQKIVKDMIDGTFLSYMGFESFMLTAVTSGGAPITSLLDLVIQAFVMGIVRFVSFFYQMKFNHIVLREHQKNKNKKAQ